MLLLIRPEGGEWEPACRVGFGGLISRTSRVQAVLRANALCGGCAGRTLEAEDSRCLGKRGFCWEEGRIMGLCVE